MFQSIGEREAYARLRLPGELLCLEPLSVQAANPLAREACGRVDHIRNAGDGTGLFLSYEGNGA